MRVDELGLDRVAAAVAALRERGRIDLVERIAIPEAEVFLCRARGRRFNVKFDVAYGASVEAVDRFSAQELADLERELVDAAH
ncbi:hypothetical protein J5226_09475 [Lysobacter sp. K5869]|uniref:hypothetical protein n=1 Tax=Lysobacter sp. K5869 TaxID=2820808 RepID=UPI001C05FE3C|nr:hypothetical protein [Lysobacter sp. K5869]QWP78599.1 hypothetical protein J5226_09475 [Lysobacter sp. K5869]